ncbi:CopG family transcriptional regulator [Paenibacillus lycopersici]|uniref:CopG family transcriptional regulator n=1 Tax=Paenibacillus lycopersici TaxID=2704462 RepID=A0A6C0G412_9BACL|nr:CopG family transcriptional regulator [Paenibacillus lycopersici]QHT63292.1 CopG family transcriptional regulator [Paenibacillus lycopersici]
MKKAVETKKMQHGGARPGAGRKSEGDKKVVTITLPTEDWALIDAAIEQGAYKGYADYFRQLQERHGRP